MSIGRQSLVWLKSGRVSEVGNLKFLPSRIEHSEVSEVVKLLNK